MLNENRIMEVHYWGIRLGEAGKYVRKGKEGNYIAIGWGELGSLEWLAQEKDGGDALPKLLKRYKTAYGGSDISVGIKTAIVNNFVRVIKEGDIVVVPDVRRGKVLLGTVTGGYKYKEDWEDGCAYQNRREVKWINKELDRDELPPKLKASLHAWLTVFKLNHRKQDIMTLLGQKPEVPEQVVTGDELAKVVIERFFNIEPQVFEKFITNLFSLVGFEAATTQYVGDKGIDVVGTLNAEGLTNITLKAQVRRVRGNIGIGDIQQLRGALEQDEHGVFITTGSFSKPAQEEAQAEKKKPITLIDKEELVDLILSHYEELDARYKEILQLQKRDIPTREQYSTNVARL